MHKFQDSRGRVWEIALSIHSFKRAMEVCHVDLQQPHAGHPQPLVVRLVLCEDMASAILLGNLLFVLVEEQAKKANVTDVDFGSSLGGEALAAALDAFLNEWEAYFKGARKQVLADVIAGARALVAKALDAAQQRAAHFDVDDAVRKAFDAADEQPEAEPDETAPEAPHQETAPTGAV